MLSIVPLLDKATRQLYTRLAAAIASAAGDVAAYVGLSIGLNDIRC